MIKNIFVFDLDDTLGKKTPLMPAITPENGAYLRELASSSENLLCIATSRPRAIAVNGLKNAGIDEKEAQTIFPIGVYEDGFFVQNRGKTVYTALNDVDPLFKTLRDAFYDSATIDLLRKNGFFLVPDGDVILESGVYRLKKFKDSKTETISVPGGLTLIQGQDNDVKQVYRSHLGFLENDMNKQQPFFERVGRLAEQNFNTRYPGWREVAELVIWKDAVDLYPRLKDKGIYLKGHGLEIALAGEQISEDVRIYLCGDGKNDIQMVEWAANRFENYHVVCPSNLSSDLKTCLEQGRYNHTILRQDCTRFAEGLKEIVDSI